MAASIFTGNEFYATPRTFDDVDGYDAAIPMGGAVTIAAWIEDAPLEFVPPSYGTANPLTTPDGVPTDRYASLCARQLADTLPNPDDGDPAVIAGILLGAFAELRKVHRAARRA